MNPFEHNKDTYRAGNIVSAYLGDEALQPPEAAIKSALKPTGLFAFSSHNLDWWKRNPNRPGAFLLRRGVRENLSELKRFLVEKRNFRRNKRHEIVVRND